MFILVCVLVSSAGLNSNAVRCPELSTGFENTQALARYQRIRASRHWLDRHQVSSARCKYLRVGEALEKADGYAGRTTREPKRGLLVDKREAIVVTSFPE